MTPGIGGAACTWAQTAFGAACAASRATNTRRNSGCFMKISFQLPVAQTLAVYNTFSMVMVSSPLEALTKPGNQQSCFLLAVERLECLFQARVRDQRVVITCNKK